MGLYYPLTKAEFKVFLSVIENGYLEVNRDLDVFDINHGQYHITIGWNESTYKVNQVRMGLWASRAIRKSIKRNLLKANVLTEAGQVLYGSNK